MLVKALWIQAQLDNLATERAYAAEVRMYSIPELKHFAIAIATDYKIKDIDRFLWVASCESGWNPYIQSNYLYKGKRENSWGLYQIFLDVHTTVTKEQAIDPIFNITWAASKWSDAPHHWKTCYASFSDG